LEFRRRSSRDKKGSPAKWFEKWKIESHCEGVWVPEVATLPAGLTASGGQAGCDADLSEAAIF